MDFKPDLVASSHVLELWHTISSSKWKAYCCPTTIHCVHYATFSICMVMTRPQPWVPHFLRCASGEGASGRWDHQWRVVRRRGRGWVMARLCKKQGFDIGYSVYLWGRCGLLVAMNSELLRLHISGSDNRQWTVCLYLDSSQHKILYTSPCSSPLEWEQLYHQYLKPTESTCGFRWLLRWWLRRWLSVVKL
jgi:hypothetical protein